MCVIGGGDTFPEAEVDEVLDSLRQRIRKMFSWAKSDVAGFEDLSPLDQKALLRRTVAELVMLGFARASIAYDGTYMYSRRILSRAEQMICLLRLSPIYKFRQIPHCMEKHVYSVPKNQPNILHKTYIHRQIMRGRTLDAQP